MKKQKMSLEIAICTIQSLSYILMFICLSGSQSAYIFPFITGGRKNGGFKINLASDNGKGLLDSVSHAVMFIL